MWKLGEIIWNSYVEKQFSHDFMCLGLFPHVEVLIYFFKKLRTNEHVSFIWKTDHFCLNLRPHVKNPILHVEMLLLLSCKLITYVIRT